MPVRRRAILIGAAFAAIAAVALAQPQRPRYTSPIAEASVTIAGRKINVEYYAPSAHGRKIMGALVPYGQVWCTGANWATKITTDADLQVGALKLPKGSYSIWTIPNEKEWTLIINSETGQFHLNYDSSRDFGRTKMSVKTLPSMVETFQVALSAAGGNKGTLALIWENTEASVPLAVLP
ncbi:MAG TPA: DUF2911 domain-containing protein [Bryobacteraceae bacterium]|nr:DUF2911 domain-containing protein [Bryobacteraceae bacterium]